MSRTLGPNTRRRGHSVSSPRRGLALCLSGGGYRAALFHAGTLWRLHEVGLLDQLDHVSSVSGGSITAAALALGWRRLQSNGSFHDAVVGPLRSLASHTVDAPAALRGLFLFGSAGDHLARAYDRYLCEGATLQDLPSYPLFVFNATSLQTGALWRFGKPYMADYRVGRIDAPRLPLAVAVAASSAFPPFLAPVRLCLEPAHFLPGSGADLQRDPYTSRVVLADGGVYDNMGLETVWKNYRTVLVSDAGAAFEPCPRPPTDWGRLTLRVLFTIDNQVRSLRKRQLISAFRRGDRDGAYWGVRSDLASYGLDDPLPCPPHRTRMLADLPTRLRKLPDLVQERLVNWGYAACDAAIRCHVDRSVPPPAGFPYPSAGV
ncbi:MAG TPA: patatin-like phospholipase family protein [Rubricoccaceae bacterium]